MLVDVYVATCRNLLKKLWNLWKKQEHSRITHDDVYFILLVNLHITPHNVLSSVKCTLFLQGAQCNGFV